MVSGISKKRKTKILLRNYIWPFQLDYLHILTLKYYICLVVLHFVYTYVLKDIIASLRSEILKINITFFLKFNSVILKINLKDLQIYFHHLHPRTLNHFGNV